MRIQKTVCLLVVGFLLTGAGLAQENGPTREFGVNIPQIGFVEGAGSMLEWERFGLFSECSPMRLLVYELPPDASKTSLTKDLIRVYLESRLRSARLYDSAAFNFLSVATDVVTSSFYSLELKYHKVVYDPASKLVSTVETWNECNSTAVFSACGLPGGGLETCIDRFLEEFLRVNEEACEKRFALPEPRNDE